MQSVFSDHWHLVATLKPKLRQNAVIHRHLYRDEVWYLLRDEVTGQFHRFSENAYQIIGLLDGRFTLDEIWQTVCEKLGDEMPTQDETIELLQKLYNANALNVEISADIERFSQRREALINQKRMKQWATPFGIKVPLFQPQDFLESYQFIGRLFFNRGFLLLACLLWLVGINITVTHWDGLTQNLSDRLLAPNGLILMAVVYPIIKVIHEFAHAFAVRKYGGEVHEMGVMLLVFFPIPYVDATAANGFASKYQRMLVAASGILAELILAALALIVWVNAEEGVLRALAFYVAITAGVSSIFFNGNPLLRFDAYYVLADWLELPNLANRANQHLGFIAKKYLFHLPNQSSIANTLSEAWIFSVYGTASFVYRILIFVWIGLFVAESYWFIGVVMIIWAGTVTLLIPAYKNWNKLLKIPEVKHHPTRFWSRFFGLVSLIVLLFSALPMPYSSSFEGTIPAMKSYSIKVQSEGHLVYLTPESQVEEGQLLAELDSTELDLQIAKIQSQLDEVQRKITASVSKPIEMKWLMAEAAILERDLAEKQHEKQNKHIRTTQTGIWISDQHLGQYFRRGDRLGFIQPQQTGEIYAMVSEQEMALLDLGAEVRLRFASQPLDVFSARIKSISPSASQELVSPILSQAGGGEIVLAETEQMQTLENFFTVVIESTESWPLVGLEERVYILVQHPAEPIVYRWLRYIRQSFLTRFDV